MKVLRFIAVLILALVLSFDFYTWLHRFNIGEASVLVVAKPDDGQIVEMLEVFETAGACMKYKVEVDKDRSDLAAWSKCVTVTEIHNP